jgi:flagellar motor switch protein FliM
MTELSEEELKAVVNAVQSDAAERRASPPQRPVREVDLTERSASAAASMETMNLIITGTLREHLVSFGDEAKGFEQIEMTGAEVQDSRVSLVSGGGVAFVFNALGETSILSVDLIMARQLGRVLLGDRTPVNESEVPPPLARSEARVLERAVKMLLMKLSTALHVPSVFEVLKTEAIGPRLRLSLPAAPMWAIRFAHPETRGSICIAFPYELARRTLSEAKPISVPKDLPSRKRYQSMVLTTEVDVVAVLGKANIAMDEWLGLEVGEVLLLDRLASAPLDLLVNDTKKYECLPSVDTGKVAVEITRLIVEPGAT